MAKSRIPTYADQSREPRSRFVDTSVPNRSNVDSGRFCPISRNAILSLCLPIGAGLISCYQSGSDDLARSSSRTPAIFILRGTFLELAQSLYIPFRARAFCTVSSRHFPDRTTRRCLWPISRTEKALISITDHADHDSCHKVSALFFGSSLPAEQESQKQGFAGLELPFTKTVFTKTDAPDGAGLHNPDYIAICNRACAAGIELGPHGIHETVEPPLSEFAGLIEPFKAYSPRTWIDHGRSFHCNYRLSGWDPKHPYNLDQILGPLGIHCIWAGFDFGLAVPNRSLNQLQMKNFSGSRYLRDLPRSAWRAIRAGRPWAIAHEIATIVFQMMPDGAMKQYFEMHRHIESFVWGRKLSSLPPAFREMIQLTMLVAKPSNLREVFRQFFGPRAELLMAPVMYPEHETLADPVRQRWLFNTIAVHDVEDAYSPRCVQQLEHEYGFHIAHTYLTSMSRAHLSHALAAASRCQRPLAANSPVCGQSGAHGAGASQRESVGCLHRRSLRFLAPAPGSGSVARRKRSMDHSFTYESFPKRRAASDRGRKYAKWHPPQFPALSQCIASIRNSRHFRIG